MTHKCKHTHTHIAHTNAHICTYTHSYWVIRGLLASELRGTARQVVLNMLGQVDPHGHVLNGARTYYTNRR